jgi:hypothetical protein
MPRPSARVYHSVMGAVSERSTSYPPAFDPTFLAPVRSKIPSFVVELPRLLGLGSFGLGRDRLRGRVVLRDRERYAARIAESLRTGRD